MIQSQICQKMSEISKEIVNKSSALEIDLTFSIEKGNMGPVIRPPKANQTLNLCDPDTYQILTGKKFLLDKYLLIRRLNIIDVD